jgi:hypothetical protein
MDRREDGLDAALEALGTLYRQVELRIAEQNPRCSMDGACCRFTTSGLNLFVTPLEVAYLIHKSGPPPRPPMEGICPYQEDARCGAREGRPLGCRIYFCDPGMKEVMPGIYEPCHQEIMALHNRHGLRYSYLELVQALVFTRDCEVL